MFTFVSTSAILLLTTVRVAGLSAKQLYQFSNATFIENVAFAPDGDLILNTFDQGRIYSLDVRSEEPEPRILVEVNEFESVTGITEIAPGVFAITRGLYDGESSLIKGSCKVATFDLKNCAGKGPVATISASIPETEMLNGLVALPHKPYIVLSADSIGGRIFRINTITGEFDVAFEDKKLGFNPSLGIPLGINGIHIYKSFLYFTNSNRRFFARVKINHDGDAVGEIEELAHLPEGSGRIFDDFDMNKNGEAYIGLQFDSLAKITRDGKVITLIGPDSEIKLLRPTSTVLSKDEKELYVVTGGSENSNEGGQVIRVQL